MDSLGIAAVAAERFNAVKLAGSHQDCFEALHQLRLICALQSAAETVAGMFWFDSLQHLLQAAPVTTGEACIFTDRTIQGTFVQTSTAQAAHYGMVLERTREVAKQAVRCMHCCEA